jgi:3-hydroxyisobutyrate dehydrogenase/2-hydroxy-3-oxopropionate reductase
MIGGDPAAFERVRHWLEPMGRRLYYCGGPGIGLHTKLSQNLILSNILMAFNEGMVLAVKAGMDPALMLEILENSAAKSGLIAQSAVRLSPGLHHQISTKWMHKDVGLVLESGKHLNVPLILTSVTQQLFQAAVSAGLGDEVFCSSINVLEEIAGVEVPS